MYIVSVIDIDECMEGTHDCDVNANCVDIQGSYICTCKENYTGNGTYCGMYAYIFIILNRQLDLGPGISLFMTKLRHYRVMHVSL